MSFGKQSCEPMTWTHERGGLLWKWHGESVWRWQGRVTASPITQLAIVQLVYVVERRSFNLNVRLMAHEDLLVLCEPGCSIMREIVVESQVSRVG